jgi:uncharacterized protein DUF6941
MDRFVSTTFCDDIRLEIGNKISLIGVYQGVLYVPSFPFVLPKLCLLVTVTTKAKNPFKNVAVRILKNDQQVAEHSFAGIGEIPLPQELASEDVANQLQSLSTPLVFTPLSIEEPMKIRVRVDADGEELKGAGLLIAKAPTQPNSG